jgi:DNA polymerase-3 subunit alpha
MGAIKGVGAGAVAAIVEEEKMENTIDFGLTNRIDLQRLIKKALESLALAGGFDSFFGNNSYSNISMMMETESLHEKSNSLWRKIQENKNRHR